MARQLLLAGGRRALRSRIATCVQELQNSDAIAACATRPDAVCQATGAVASSVLQHPFQLRHLSADFPMLGVAPADAATPPDAGGIEADTEELSQERFHRAADLTMGNLLQRIDAFLEEQPRSDAYVDMTEGRLQVKLGQGRGLLINKDPEARQLHTSSPSGDVSYALDSDPGKGRWVSVEGGRDLHESLQQEIESATGASIDLEPEPHMGYGPDPT